ncbi:unnamed protein product, partial [Pocillopora meandrina]
LKIVFIVVQWENENSVSVVKEKKVVSAVELKEWTTVDILTGTNKGRVAICKATILKVCVAAIYSSLNSLAYHFRKQRGIRRTRDSIWGLEVIT